MPIAHVNDIDLAYEQPPSTEIDAPVVEAPRSGLIPSASVCDLFGLAQASHRLKIDGLLDVASRETIHHRRFDVQGRTAFTRMFDLA